MSLYPFSESKVRYRQPTSLRPRALILGVCLIAANVYWLTVTNEIWYGLHMTLASLFFNAVFTLFILVCINFLLQRYLPAIALSRQELLVIYVMVVMASTIAEYSLIAELMGSLSYPFWFATPENEYAELFLGHVRSWITVSDLDVLRGYFTGDSSFHWAENLRAWLVPFAVWGSFIFVLWFVLICFNVLIRKQWTEHEKLSYPIIQLPLEMTDPKTRVFRSRAMWLGFAIAGSIDLINGLHVFFPSVPEIPVRRIEINRYFTERPWNAIGYTTISLYPFVIGLTYFVPLDLAFSCWFFHFLSKVELVISSAVGWRALPRAPYINEQAAGAWLMIGAIAVFMLRRHLAGVVKIAFRRDSKEDLSEPMRYRTALLGMLLGLICLTVFCYEAGMSLGIVLAFLLIYLIMAIGIARVRAEVGPPVHGMVFVNPRQILVAGFGTRFLGVANLTNLSFLYAFNRCNRMHPMPNQLEAFKIAERAGIRTKRFVPAILLAIFVSIIASFWIHTALLYKHGASTGTSGFVPSLGSESFRPLRNWLSYPGGPDLPAVSFMGIAAIIVIFLTIMRRRFIGWPFHPAGYALGNNTWGGIVYIWFAVFVGWLVKWIILRHGGLKAYRRAVPFFLGLILGEYVVACLWCLFGIIFDMNVIRVWV
jgi:hypothetical protein